MTEPNPEAMPTSVDADAPESAPTPETAPAPEAPNSTEEIPPNPEAPPVDVASSSEPVIAEAAPPVTEPVVSTPEAPAKPGNEDAGPATVPAPPVATTSTIFPCIEQPLRVTLHCNGYYLWGLRKGKVIARKKRSERDEFRLTYINEGQIMEITNHKFGGMLSVVVGEEDNSRKVVCIKQDEVDEKKKEGEKANGETTAPATAAAAATLDNSTTSADAELEEGFEDEPAIDKKDLTEEDRQWCFVKGTHGRNEVLLKSLRTGENLGIDEKGNIVFTTSDNPDDNPTTTITWDIECVTGELCYISNPVVDSRIRCDIAGLLTLTDSWKGWEVFRLMEAGHGYVKISSWMHSQNLLCSSSDGTVTTCSHAESFLEDNPKGCPKWAIEKFHGDNNRNDNAHKGVIIRSKTFGRLLSVHEGYLRTYDPAEESEIAIASAAASQETTTEGKNWWNNSLKSVNNNMRNSMKGMQKRFSSASVKSASGEDIFLPNKDTLVWQLEAAHLQTYYFISAVEGEAPRSLGPFPEVTANLRKTEKIQLVREETGITRLILVEKKQYIACSAEGNIDFVNSVEDASTEWVMEKPSYQAGGSVFRSRIHNLYLSYEDTEEDVEIETGGEKLDASEKNQGHFGNLFGGKKEKVGMLLGSETIGLREVWKLEPCMPRAVSSEKIKTFALGTSIAVGTTIAMPFALAGMGAILGAVGAEVGFVANAIAVGLTGAEALASVGAIGATAYIVFRPEENSLTDDHKKDEEEEAERAWSKRPFSNWRNW